MNTRLLVIVILLTAVIASALGVVYTRHDKRRAAVHLSELEEQRDELIAEWSRLQLEQAWLGDAVHVEVTARDRLGMNLPEESTILVVRP